MPTPAKIKTSRWSQISAWIVAIIFVLGWMYSSVGMWTQPVLGVWFVLTQKPRRGLVWMVLLTFVPGLIFGWRHFPLTGPIPAGEFLGTAFLTALLGALPFTFHRLVSPRLPGVLATLPFGLAAVAIPALAFEIHPGFAKPASLLSFVLCWLAAIVVSLWNQSSRATFFVFLAGLLPANAAALFHLLGLPFVPLGANVLFIKGCLGASLLLALWAAFHPLKQKSWASRSETVAQLKSPFTGSPLHFVNEGGRELLLSAAGERFPIRKGIPVLLKPEDLTGDNGKYNHLYETIGGFYDDTQRFFAAFRGLDVDSYFENYMSLLDVKPGDSVLETSVGTGLNLKYLPDGVKRTGLDLSPEMLANCQANLRRWQMDADLYLGNAERLPFADNSFDVVFNAGAINFFNDRAQAIREMIRVAKPGSMLLVEDETEEYVKSTYKNIPFTSSFYKGREKPVTVPVDLVPPEMENIHVDMLKDGKFYAITFCKPLAQSVEFGQIDPDGVLVRHE
jgi:ubiquinone/menaquinone biosynthesis C-methylase UbiE